MPEQNQQTDNIDQESSANFLEEDEFLSGVHEEAKYTADTVVHITEDGQKILEVPGKTSVLPSSQPYSEDDAIKNTQILMDIRETVQAYGISWFCDGSISEHVQYLYSKGDKDKLVRAWAPIVQQAGLRVPPMANVLVVEAICSGPIIAMGIQNRKYRMQAEKYKAELDAERVKNGKEPTRGDTQRDWLIHSNGFFQWSNKTGKWIYQPKDSAKERPDISEKGIYERLVKHNPKLDIDSIYKTR